MAMSRKRANSCYDPLKDGLPYYFRVLDLSPGRWDDQLRGKLRTVSLDRKPKFEALSYTWGSPATGEKTITIDNTHHLPITENLYLALRRLRSTTVKRTIWIDAICINQNDVAEQGRQVSIMGDIYEAAHRVLVWLGEYSNATIYDRWQMRRPHFDGLYLRNSRGRKFTLSLNEAISSTDPKWHDRAWTIQEFCMAREIQLCFGPIKSFYDPVHMVDLMMYSVEPLESLRAFHARVSDMHKLKLGLLEQKQSIREALLYTSAASCSKPRDKVYSLLSLIDNRESGFIKLDIRELSEHAFARATLAAVMIQGEFQIFELISFNQPRVANLPTWAVDFTMRQSPDQGRIHQMHRANVAWKDVSFEMETTERLEWPLVKNLDHFELTGIHLDKVSAAVEIAEANASAPGSETAEKIAEFFDALVQTRVGHTGDNTAITFAYTDASFTIDPSDLLIYGSETRVFNVINAAFVLWNMVTGFSGRLDADALPSAQNPLGPDGTSAVILRNLVEKLASSAIPYMEYAHFVSGGCVLFATIDGFIGLAPKTLADDDLIILVNRSKFPIILRQQGDLYLFRGLAYVHGIWNRELVSAWKDRDLVERRYILV